MTKKDYVLIAEVLKNKYQTVQDWHNPTCISLMLAIFEDFANTLKKENPKFNKVKFYKYIDKNFLIG